MKHKWRSCIRKNGKGIHIGYFETEELAAGGYNGFARKHFGDYALLNNVSLEIEVAALAIAQNPKKRGRGKYKGTTFIKNCITRPWAARISVKGKPLTIGRFGTEIEAAQAYNDEVKRLGMNRPINIISY